MSIEPDAQQAASVLASLPDPVVAVGPDLALIWGNHAAERRFGWRLDELRGRRLDAMLHPDDHATAVLSMASVGDKEVGTAVEVRLLDRTGDYGWFEVRGASWADGPEGSVVVVLRETTDRRRWEVAAGDEQVLSAVVDAAPTLLLLLEPDGTIRGANRALTRSLGRPLEGTLGRPLGELVVDGDRAMVADRIAVAAGSRTAVRLEAGFQTADGEVVPMSLTLVDLTADQAVRGLVAAASDITSLVVARTELHHLANHDGLTGLPNRTSLLVHLETRLAGARRGDTTLLFGDVDGLKPVNDRYGHRAGDAVLVEVAARLRSVLRPGDFVARVSGDEFVIVLPTVAAELVRDVVRRIERVLAEPVVLPDGTRVAVSMSVGAATTEATVDADELLATADAAMYVAKRERASAATSSEVGGAEQGR